MGASFGSNTHRFQCVAPLGAPSRRRYGAGPRFLRSVSSRLRPSSTAPFGQPHRRASGRPHGPPSASSSRGVIVPPGGTPAPPECVGCVIPTPAGAASCSIIKTPLDDALTRAGRTHNKPAPASGDKFSRECDYNPRIGFKCIKFMLQPTRETGWGLS